MSRSARESPDRHVRSTRSAAGAEPSWFVRTAGGVGAAALLGLATLPWVLGPAIAVLPGIAGFLLGIPLASLLQQRRPSPPGETPALRYMAIGLVVAIVAGATFLGAISRSLTYLPIALMVAAPAGVVGGLVVALVSTVRSRAPLLAVGTVGVVSTVVVTIGVVR